MKIRMAEKHVLVGERVALQRRVGQKLGRKSINEAVRVGGAHPAGPIVDDLHGRGVLGEEVRIVAVEHEYGRDHLGELAEGVVHGDWERARVMIVLVEEGQAVLGGTGTRTTEGSCAPRRQPPPGSTRLAWVRRFHLGLG